MNESITLRTTLIWHDFRRKHCLSCDEYVLCDMIFHLSKSDASEVPGWCYKSKENMAKDIGISKQGLLNMIERMEKKGFLEKNDQTKHLKTTKKWQDVYFDIEQSNFRPSVNKLYQEQSTNLTSAGQQTLPNTNTDISKDNCIDTVDGEHKKIEAERKKNYTQWTIGEFHAIVHSYAAFYDKEKILKPFYENWKQKSGTNGKMKFQCEPFWNMETRLRNWADKQIEIDNRQRNGNTQNQRSATYFAGPGTKLGTSEARVKKLNEWGSEFINRDDKEGQKDRAVGE